tara:strand:+ start:337 stop:693 length:357 start_codon:yes stop_codon:yes gene_type:complete
MSSYITKFKQVPLKTRLADSKRLCNKYKDRCCIIVGKNDKSDVPDIERHKFLVPNSLTVGQFIYIIRSRIKCKSNQALFLFINGKIPATSQRLIHVYEANKEEDGFLYVTYTGENTFG